MDFNLPAEDDPCRMEVRTWLEANTPCTPRKLADRGFAVPHWPRPWGLAADAELQLIIDDEIARAGVRSPSHMNPAAVNNCAQSLLTFGTQAQQRRFIPPALAAEEIWCRLFSEPSAGSDRVMLNREVDLSHLLRPAATIADAGHKALWSTMIELGWPAMIIPEAAGGPGMTCVDLSMIIGECGRTLAPSSLAGVLAGSLAVIGAGSAEQQARLL